MRNNTDQFRKTCAVRALLLLLAATLAGSLGAQSELETPLDAKRRILPSIGPGAKALHRDAAGRYFVLASPADAVQIFGADEKAAGQVPSASPKGTGIIFAEDFALDSAGRIYIADRGGNTVRILAPDGSAATSIAVVSPISVAALPDDEVAVVSLKSDPLVQVFSARSGKPVRSFGNSIDIAEHPEVNRLINLGRLVTDAGGHLYYSFTYFPEPTIRKYDRFGWAVSEISLATLEFQGVANAARRNIVAQDQRDQTPALKTIINTIGVDPASEQVWAALGDEILVFDSDGTRRAAYRIYTPEGARIEPKSILVEPGRLLVVSDPLGVFEFARPSNSASPVPGATPAAKPDAHP
jgi:hypothetical protein